MREGGGEKKKASKILQEIRDPKEGAFRLGEEQRQRMHARAHACAMQGARWRRTWAEDSKVRTEAFFFHSAGIGRMAYLIETAG